MKWIAALLACLVLFLSVQPACGVAIHTTSQQDACCEAGCPDGSDKAGAAGEDACAGCNPFQSCACCVTGVVPPLAFMPATNAHKPAVNAPKSVLVLLLPETEAAGFWRPPRP